MSFSIYSARQSLKLKTASYGLIGESNYVVSCFEHEMVSFLVVYVVVLNPVLAAVVFNDKVRLAPHDVAMKNLLFSEANLAGQVHLYFMVEQGRGHSEPA